MTTPSPSLLAPFRQIWHSATEVLRCSDSGGCAAAIIICGLARQYDLDATGIMRHVLLPLQSTHQFSVDIHACLGANDESTPLARQLQRLPGASVSFEDFPYTHSRDQFLRLESCWRRAARSKTYHNKYSLYVRLRTDMQWIAPLTLPTLDAVVLRAREIRLAAEEHVTQQQVSIPCDSSFTLSSRKWAKLALRYASTRAEADHCVAADDQVALVPALFAHAYFSVNPAPALCNRSVSEWRECRLWLTGHSLVYTGEHNLTARLLGHCVPIVVYPLPVALSHRDANHSDPDRASVDVWRSDAKCTVRSRTSFQTSDDAGVAVDDDR
jgi:hypothetical protein